LRSHTIRQQTEPYADMLPKEKPENESQNTLHSIMWAVHLQRTQRAS